MMIFWSLAVPASSLTTRQQQGFPREQDREGREEFEQELNTNVSRAWGFRSKGKRAWRKRIYIEARRGVREMLGTREQV